MLYNKKYWNDLLKKYHPDNIDTGDEDIFVKIHNDYKLNQSKKIIIKKEIPYTTLNNISICTPSNKIITIPQPKKSKSLYLPSIIYKNDDEFIEYKLKIIGDENISIKKIKNEIYLYKKIDLTYLEMLIGTSKKLIINNEDLFLTIPKNFNILLFNTKIIKNLGIKYSDGQGDIFIDFFIKKMNLTEQELIQLKRVKDSYD